MKHALVTGASSGIGRAVAEALLGDGWRVQGASRRRPVIDHERFSWIGTDLLSKYQAERIGNVLHHLEAPLDALVHAAATYGPHDLLGDTEPDEWVRTITVNLTATYRVVHSTLPYLRRSEDGRILLFSGGGAFNPHPGRSAYAVSKAGVVSLMETLASEEEGRVAVNCVAPSYVPTPLHGLPDGPSEQMDRAVACIRHLLAPETRGLTGKTVSAQYDDWELIGPHNVESLNDSLLGNRHRYLLAISDVKTSPYRAEQARAGVLV